MSKTLSKPLEVNMHSGKCEGHFKGYPIVPAAVMIQWVLDFLNEQTGERPSSYTLTRIKCLRELTPCCVAELRLEETTTGWQASVSENSEPCLNMRLMKK